MRCISHEISGCTMLEITHFLENIIEIVNFNPENEQNSSLALMEQHNWESLKAKCWGGYLEPRDSKEVVHSPQSSSLRQFRM